MPYITNPPNDSYRPSQELPLHLDHKPVYALPYEKFDGPDAGQSDVQFISIGIAQYDPDEVSVKTMRHTGRKWTRQAEELPLNRVIDMTLFLAKSLFDVQGGDVVIPKGTFCNQEGTEIRISRERANGELPAFDKFIERNREHCKNRLNALLKVLSELKRNHRI